MMVVYYRVFISLLCSSVFFVAGLRDVVAHDEKSGESGDTEDRVVVKQGERTLEFRMVPQCTLKASSPASACTCEKKGDGPSLARVGNLAFLFAELTENDQPVANVDYTLVFHHDEDDKEVFSTRLFSPEGELEWGQQFFDGAAHRVTLTAKSTDDSFDPITASMLIGVEAIQPPGHIVARTLTLLLAMVAGMLVVGYMGTYWLMVRQVGSVSSSVNDGG